MGALICGAGQVESSKWYKPANQHIGAKAEKDITQHFQFSPGTLTIAGPHHPVEIIRDEWGYPHIYAQVVDDALFAQGFVHAQDRCICCLRIDPHEFNKEQAFSA